MESWSDSPVHEGFCVKFFVDTNILVYLIDNTYPILNEFIDFLNKLPFARIISSRYVIFEFVGVRKKEHYFRIAAENSGKTPDGKINFSSLFKYRDQFNNPGIDFEKEIKNIKTFVDEEVEKIARDFNIDFEYSSLHADQLQPTIEVCLSSKISNHDSLVLVSAVLPQIKETNKVLLLTNDSSFVSSYDSADISNIFILHSILAPELLNINSVYQGINLVKKDGTPQTDLNQNIIKMLAELISKKMSNNFLGRTFTPYNPSLPNDLICFKLTSGKSLKNGVYITIIGENLNFIYTSKKAVEFWSNGEPIQNEFTPQSDSTNISCKVVDVDDIGNVIPVQVDIMDAIKAKNNMVFIHPDNS